MQKLDKLADTKEKLETVRAVKQLQQASKRASGQTTIIQVSAVFWCNIYPGQIQVGPRPAPDAGQAPTVFIFNRQRLVIHDVMFRVTMLHEAETVSSSVCPEAAETVSSSVCPEAARFRLMATSSLSETYYVFIRSYFTNCSKQEEFIF